MRLKNLIITIRKKKKSVWTGLSFTNTQFFQENKKKKKNTQEPYFLPIGFGLAY